MFRCPCVPLHPRTSSVRERFIDYVGCCFALDYQKHGFEKLTLVFFEPGGLLDEWRLLNRLLKQNPQLFVDIILVEPLAHLPHIVRARRAFEAAVHQKYADRIGSIFVHDALDVQNDACVLVSIDAVSENMLPDRHPVNLRSQIVSGVIQWHALWCESHAEPVVRSASVFAFQKDQIVARFDESEYVVTDQNYYVFDVFQQGYVEIPLVEFDGVSVPRSVDLPRNLVDLVARFPRFSPRFSID